MAVVYEGDDIFIEEMPQGCIIGKWNDYPTITISSLPDALAVIESLQKMIKIQFGDEDGTN